MYMSLALTMRFFQRYYVVNFCCIFSYALVRHFKTSRSLQAVDGFLGIPKEMSIISMLAVALFGQYRKSATIDEFVGKAIMFGKVAVLVLLFYLDTRLMTWYLVLYFGTCLLRDKY